MSTLSSASRDDLPDSAFAIVRGSGDNKTRDYPIHDRSHAANALARVAQHGSPEEKAAVRRAVCRRYPDMGICHSMKLAARMRGKGSD